MLVLRAPQKQNAFVELRIRLPGQARPVFSGGRISTYLLVPDISHKSSCVLFCRLLLPSKWKIFHLAKGTSEGTAEERDGHFL